VISGRPVDLDTLADYVEGVLDADATAEVDSLIADDPAWSAAHAQLIEALPQVTSALAAVPAESMPAEVSLRIGDALRSLDRHANVVSMAAARRSRFGSRSTWLKVAAAVIFLGLFLGLLPRVIGSSSSGGTDKNAASSGGSNALSEQIHTPVKLTNSGIDYSKSTLERVPAPAAPPVAAGSVAPDGGVRGSAKTPASVPSGETFGAESVPAPLARLASTPALDVCLHDVAAALGGTPVSVDFARYQGRPALIIGFSDLPYSVAVGAACGETGADILARG
jgi:hypothetical protein